MARKRLFKVELLFLRRWKAVNHLDRATADLEVRQALRRNDKRGIYWAACQHPLKPVRVTSKGARYELERHGFIFIPGTYQLMVPPGGMSRRQARRFRDRVLGGRKREANREIRKATNRIYPRPWS